MNDDKRLSQMEAELKERFREAFDDYLKENGEEIPPHISFCDGGGMCCSHLCHFKLYGCLDEFRGRTRYEV